MTCPDCRASGVVEIRVQLDETSITMQSCSGCDSRHWYRNGEAIGLQGVLAMVPRRS
jgi:hypothetical protein